MFKKTFARQSPNLGMTDFKAVYGALKSGQVFEGPSIEKFEKELARYLGVKYVLVVNMGRTAEYVALKGMDFSQGDEIILPSYNFPIVPIVVKMQGLKPVFVDVEEDTFNIDPSLIEKSITSKTKAIFITHMCGHPCEMDKIIEIKNKYGLGLIEDGVHSLGAIYKGRKVGIFGDVSYFSFYVGKTMTTFMGACVCTSDRIIFNRMRQEVGKYRKLNLAELFREVGYGIVTYFLTKPTIFGLTIYPFLIGLNAVNSQFFDTKMEETLSIPKELDSAYLSRFSNLQAAVGLTQLRNLEDSIFKRIRNSSLLSNEIIPGSSISLPAVGPEVRHSFLYYFIRTKYRQKFRKRLLLKGVDTKRDSNLPCSHLTIFKEEQKHCPVSERISQENILIPNYPALSEKDVLYIADKINQVIREMVI